MSTSAGRIICEEAYAQGKMLDHSGLALCNNITPSDIDFVIERWGGFLWVELTRGPADFNALSFGQRRMYAELSRIPGNHAVVLARHSVHGRRINTATDIEQLCIRWNGGHKQIVLDGSAFAILCQLWSEDPQKALAKLNAHHAKFVGANPE